MSLGVGGSYTFTQTFFKPSHPLAVDVWQLQLNENHLLHIILKLLNETGWVPFTVMHLEDFFFPFQN